MSISDLFARVRWWRNEAEFDPDIRIAQGEGADRFAVLVDTRLAEDTLHESRWAWINLAELSPGAGSFRFSVTFEGTQSHPGEDEHLAAVAGTINVVLVGRDRGDEVISICPFRIDARDVERLAKAWRTRRDMAGRFPMEIVKDAIRRGVAQSATLALDEFFWTRQGGDATHAEPPPRRGVWRLLRWPVVATMATFFVLWLGASHRAGNAHANVPAGAPRSNVTVPQVIDPATMTPAGTLADGTSIADAVKQRMDADPKAAEQQVAMVQKVMKDMGLDPGRAQDMSCLSTTHLKKPGETVPLPNGGQTAEAAPAVPSERPTYSGADVRFSMER